MRALFETLGLIIDALGVAVIVVGGGLAAVAAVRRLGRETAESAADGFRRGIGRAILLGLEILVAGDIVRTVAVQPTIDSLVVLGGLILIRTFLSFALEIELHGALPWRRAVRQPAGSGGLETSG